MCHVFCVCQCVRKLLAGFCANNGLECSAGAEDMRSINGYTEVLVLNADTLSTLVDVQGGLCRLTGRPDDMLAMIRRICSSSAFSS